MRISHRWLTRLFPDGALDALAVDELARRLTLQGLEVAEVRPAFATFEGVVLGRVVEAGPHPNADKLTLCSVVTGDGERQVVCGAPNVEVGALYGYATPGSRLPGDREIGRAEIRGVESEGMLCSAPELGLDALGSAEEIWRVPGVDENDVGRDLREALDLDDAIIDIEVSSNRGDELSHLGVAREAGWIVGSSPELPEAGLQECDARAGDRIGVRVEDPAGCPLYLGRLIEGIEVGPSPGWLQARLTALGMRPVNNVVDATNWTMLELGQPLHPFDLDRLAGGRVVVRAAEEGESFVTLDGHERVLGPRMTLICDAEEPIALGGVMGGLESEVTGGTTNVFLESAWFDPDRVARTSRELGLVSEASTRFARGVDPGGVERALDRAAALIARLAGGTVAAGRVEDAPGSLPERARVGLRSGRLADVVGREFDAGEAAGPLEAIGFEVEPEEEGLSAVAPGWRFDVSREADLIEEVARLTGYDAIPLEPLPAPPVAPSRRATERGLARVSRAARGAGFDEARTLSFVSSGVLGEASPVDKLIEIKNPISKAQGFLRPYVFPTLAEAVVHNLRRGADRVKLFEVGHAFRAGPEGTVEERRAVALAAAGEREPLHWSRTDPPEYDLYDLLGDVEEIVAESTGEDPTFASGEREYLHPGRQAEVVGRARGTIGFCGELHPGIADRWDVDARLLVAELDFAMLAAPLDPVSFEPFPREPAVERDLALVVPDDVRAREVVDAVRAAGLENLETVEVFDRYRGPQLPDDRYSLGLRLTFQAGRTLTDEDVDAPLEKMVESLERDRGWTLR